MQKLFHAAMRIIVEPLLDAGEHGVEMTGGDGCVRLVFPILATYVADYPEQCLVTCSKYGTCPKCQSPADKLSELQTHDPRTPDFTKSIITDAWKNAHSPAAAEASCMSRDVNGAVQKPFWSGLPHADIHMSITPDVLHQLYQGVFKHLLSWCQDLLTPEELDRRIRCLPPSFGIRHFKNGISALSQVSGKERKQMARILLACLVGKITKSTMLAFRSLLDFIYLAQYPTHDDSTLQYMDDALKTFHANKKVIMNLGIRSDLNIPKLHSLLHYVTAIRQFGTTDNYNTEMFERLHIDFAKDAWRATNHRDEFPQMVKWITRNEKMAMYEMFQRECKAEEDRNDGEGSEEDGDGIPPEPMETVDGGSKSIRIAKYAPAPQQHLCRVQELHRAPGFTTALAKFINDLQPQKLRLSRHELTQTWLPFERVDVFHSFKFSPYELLEGKDETDVVKAIPASVRTGRKDRFDTVIVLDTDQAESTGVQGVFHFVLNLLNNLDLHNIPQERELGG